MKIPKAQQLTREQHEFLRAQINQAYNSTRYLNRAKKPTAVRAAERVVANWERKQERAATARQQKLYAAKQTTLQKLLFCAADEAQSATDAFLVFAESV